MTHPEEESIPSATSVPASTPAPTSKDISSLIQGDSLAFLEAMALGISNRQNALIADESSMSWAEVLAYRKQMVEYELNEIEKYAFHVFEDKEFNDLAHMYINACKTQLYAAENGENRSLYNTLWDSGLHCRAVVIPILYEKYNLPITEEQAAYYRAQMPITIQLN